MNKDGLIELEGGKDFLRKKVVFLEDRIHNTNGKLKKVRSQPMLKIRL